MALAAEIERDLISQRTKVAFRKSKVQNPPIGVPTPSMTLVAVKILQLFHLMIILIIMIIKSYSHMSFGKEKKGGFIYEV